MVRLKFYWFDLDYMFSFEGRMDGIVFKFIFEGKVFKNVVLR